MKRVLYSLFLAFSVFLVACATSVTMDNYVKIETGMSKSEVEAILGPGNSQATSSVDMGELLGGEITSEVVTWQEGMGVISITFSNDEVLAKAQSGL